MNSIRNNSQMIIKIAQRIDEVRDDLKKSFWKNRFICGSNSDIENLKKSIEEVSGKTSQLESGAQIIESFRQEFGKITEGASSSSNLGSELEAIKVTIDAISSKASKIDSLGGVIDGLKQQFETISEKASSVDDLSLESMKELAGKIDKIETEIAKFHTEQIQLHLLEKA